MADASIAVLTDAKAEYTKQLIAILRDNIYQGIKSIYEDAKNYCNENQTPREVLIIFQKFLSQIPKWSQELIDREYSRIIENSQCDWLEDLITAVFISHTKVLTLVNQGKKHKKINIKIPKPSHFMHLCYIETAREVWRKPFIFSENLSQYEYQKNVGLAEGTIETAIAETIRKQLPVKNILREYLGDGYGSEPEEEEDIKKPVSESQKRNLKKMIKKELEQNEEENKDSDNDKDNEINGSGDEIQGEHSDADLSSPNPSDDEEEDEEMTHLRRIIRQEMKRTNNKKIKSKEQPKSIEKTVEPKGGLNVLDIDLLGHGNDNYITDTETENETEPNIPAPPVVVIPDVKPEVVVVETPKAISIENTNVRISSPVPVEIQDLNMIDLDIIDEPVAPTAQQQSPINPEPVEVPIKEDFQNELTISSNIKEVSLTSKLTNGFKNLLGMNNETKINKLDNSSYNIDGIETKKSVSIVEPTPHPQTPPPQQQQQQQQSNKPFEIKELDDNDNIFQNNDGLGDGGLSDLELDCTDIDLNEVKKENNISNSPPQFKFF